jgi:dipeptidyl aminopeptidase/acylaminoacyl peptidase
VKVPDVRTNTNEVQLFVKSLSDSDLGEGRLLATGPELAQLHWLPDGRHLTILRRVRSTVAVVSMDIERGDQQVLAQSSSDIKEYSIDRGAGTVAYAVEDSPVLSSSEKQPVKDPATGYRVVPQQTFVAQLPSRVVYVVRRRQSGGWAGPTPVTIHSPFSGRVLSGLSYFRTSALRLSLSPDGRHLLITYINSDPLPAAWQTSRTARKIFDAGLPTPLLVLEDLETNEGTIALKTYLPLSIPLWSPDSNSFAVVAMSPVDSIWEHQDQETPGALGHLFSVTLGSGVVRQVAAHVANNSEQPLNWPDNGSLLVHTSADTITKFSVSGDTWNAIGSYRMPLANMYRLAQFASDGRRVVGDYQNISTPPELFQYSLGGKSAIPIAKLNPQFGSLILAPAQTLQWKTKSGYEISGTLLVPPGYESGKRYPLVIQTKPYVGQFLCDTGVSHYPSFAPQPIADAGMLYLIRNYPEDINNDPDAGHYPTGYPGDIGEAVFNMDVWDSAVTTLSSRGMIDMKRLGIIGFSRSGWYTEYILAHSQIHYEAATAADNIQYSVGEYWASRGFLAASLEGMYGGPPYGKTLRSWMDHSITYNLDKIHTPLLMEQMGGGIAFDNDQSLPAHLLPSFEIYTALQRLNDPVELYYYPNEDHQPDHPKARQASLERNLDWYRFWLQGYQRPNPEDPDQYKRWERLRDLRSAPSSADSRPN